MPSIELWECFIPHPNDSGNKSHKIGLLGSFQQKIHVIFTLVLDSVWEIAMLKLQQ